MVKKHSNIINPLQIAVLIFIASITFKTIMLPQYLTSIAGRTAWFSILYLMLIDMIIFAIVYKTIQNTSLIDLKIPNWLKTTFISLVFMSSLFKFSLLFGETNSYIASTLFDESKKSFIFLVFLPVLAYIGYKGGNTLGRLSQLLFWLIALVLLFNLIFSTFDGEVSRLSPVIIDTSTISASDRYVCWFGDFTPFLFFKVSSSAKSKKKANISVLVSVIFAISASIAIMLLFVSEYGNASPLVANAFTKIASMNKLALIIDNVDMPTVCSLMAQIIVKLSLLFYAMIECLSFFFKRRLATTLLFTTTLGFTLYYIAGNAEFYYNVATSWFRYVILSIEYFIPMAVFLAYRKSENNSLIKTKTLSNAQNLSTNKPRSK